jgi:hypothetical protein
MVQFYSLMWILAAFGAVLGFMRGWNRELIVTAGITLAFFILFQFDSYIRGFVLLTFPRDQVFVIQIGIFLIIVFVAYQNRTFRGSERPNPNLQSSLLGALVGFFNGYLIGGSLWYFADINEYPLRPYLMAPLPGSPSAEQIGMMPITLFGGGVGGTGELLVVFVVVVFAIVLLV